MKKALRLFLEGWGWGVEKLKPGSKRGGTIAEKYCNSLLYEKSL